MMSNKKKNRFPVDRHIRGTTNFYPLYGAGRDVVEAVIPVRTIRFQAIIPRYRLSSTKTRDEGVGPAFDEVSYRPLAFPGRGLSILTAQLPHPQRSSARRKIRVNFLA